MAKKAKIIVLIFAILFAVGVFAFITGANSNSTTNDNTTNDSLNVTNNDSVNGTDIVNAMDNSTLPETIIKPVATGLYPQYTQPDIELQTSYISDTLYAGTTYTYKVQIKNIGDKDVTIDPRLNAGYPIIYPMAATGAIASTVTNVEVSNSTANNTSAPTPIPTPVPVSAPVINSASTTSAVPNMVAGSRSNGQAFDNDAVNISAPSIIPAGQIVNMTIMVTVPDNSTGSYYTSVDMNVNNVENDQNNPQLSISFTILQPIASPYMKTFSLSENEPIQIDLSADNYNSDMGTRVSPAIKDPSFDVTLLHDGDLVNLSLVKTEETGNVGIGAGMIYPVWSSTNHQAYQDYGNHFVQTYTVSGVAGDYNLSIMPKNTSNFGYTITLGNVSVK